MLGGGGFGSNQNQQSSGGIFGASTSFGVGIGQQGVSQNINTVQQPSTGLFNSSTPLFGGNVSPGLFGSAGSSGSVFGNTGQSSVFGQSSNGLFGQSMGAFGGNQQIGSSQPSMFGSSSSSTICSNSGFFNTSSANNSGGFGSFQNSFGASGGFGSQSSQSNPSNYFGQQNNGIFGSMPVQTFGNTSTSPFGGTTGTNTNIFGSKKGTNGITFQPVVDRDSDARIMSIVYQKDIDQKKSVEELRWEDYQEKRGPVNSLSTINTNFSTNNNTFGSGSFSSNSGGFGSGPQGSSITSSIFGQPQTSFIASTTPQNSLFGSSNSSSALGQTSILGQGLQNSQSSLTNPQFVSNNSGLFGTSNNLNSFALQSSTNSSNTGLFSTPNLFSSNSNNSNTINTSNSLGGGINLNSGNLFGQQPSNLGSLDSSFKTSNSLFGGAQTTSTNTGLGLFNSNSNTQPQISLSNSSLAMKPLFGNQTLSNSNLGSSTAGGTNLSLSTNLFGSTLPGSSSLFSTNSCSNNLFGSTQPQSALNNTNSGTTSSSLFGKLSSSQPFSFANINPSNSSWTSLNSGVSNATISQTNLSGSSPMNNNSIQLQNILGGGQPNKPTSSQGSSIVLGNGLSTSNKLSNGIHSKPITQNSKFSDSTDRGKSLWLWKPLPQFISRSNRYQIDGLSNFSQEGVTNSSELALPALATESARHSTSLLTSVRRIEKTIDPQTPAAFLSLLERQQQFYDAVQSPEQSSNSPVNSKTKSLVFTTSHATKFVPIDEAFEDAIDDSSSATFSPIVLKAENKSISDGSKSLINFDSISRISQDVQISKNDDSRNSIGRVSIESNNLARTPYLNQHRSSVNSIPAVSNERQARASIGLTTPRPITRRPGQLIDNNISSDVNKSYLRKQKEYIVESLTPVLTKTDYFCIPSIEVLKTFSEERLAIVEDFKIVREGVGEIIWPGVTDLRGINLDLVVSIEPLCVSVYGDGDSSIPVGEGLNKKAIVTLKNCKPKRVLSSKDPQEIDNFNKNRVKQIKSYTEQMGARFISLDTVTWEWKFEVTHFSKYSFLNEDSPLTNFGEPQSTITNDTNLIASPKESLFGQHSKQEQPSDHFFAKTSQYNFSLYSEIRSIVEKNKSLKSAYNAISFRSGMYIGSNGFVVIPHRSFFKSNHSISDYNTSITMFKMNQMNESVLTDTKNNFLCSRRLVSAWFRLYLEIIGSETIDGCCEISIESITKLVFLFWNITKKEFEFSSYLSEFKSNSLNLEYLKYFEQSFSMIGGILELIIKDTNSHSEKRLETSLREFISWWLKMTSKNIPKIKVKKCNQSSQDLHEEKIHFLFNHILNGNLFDIVQNDTNLSYLTIPRIVSLCLSIGNNRGSIFQIRENLQWWSKIGIIPDLTHNSNKIYKTISNTDAYVDDFAYEWQTNILLSVNYSTNSKLCEKFNRIKNIPLVGDKREFGNLNNSDRLIGMEDTYEVDEKKILFDQIQFQIIKFFFCDENSRQAELFRLNNSGSIKFSSSFIWLITRVLTLYNNISCNDSELKFSNKLNLALIQELEILGLWEWAVYVIIHTNMNSAFGLLNCIIMRNIQENPNYLNPEDYLNDEKWKFLVNRLGVPSNWLFEAIIYKLESNGNVLQSLRCTLHLINCLKGRKHEVGDLFFHNSDQISTINNLAISAAKKLFDASLLPTTLIRISVLLKHIITEEETLGDVNKCYDIYQLNAAEDLQLIFCSEGKEQIVADIWQTLELILVISNQYMKFAIRLLESKSYSINQDEFKDILSKLDKLVVLRKDSSKCLFEPCISNIINDECWDIILNTIEIVKHLSKVI
ncbi:FG-rich motif-containing protein [Cryptosporidium ubiquitum]|uniref:FG-rich motif-containing protein n=1 Tax=Cryptosporidium ubiquitum TaxID=857276 RepID=A0A1J4MMV5_9CRYT|nr:FG-rich motif-containing protein [Cryptosporidium ubiquitum]OII74205.1 FG-rich motif-containing protein [Cryptosporidium ubiquitum]